MEYVKLEIIVAQRMMGRIIYLLLFNNELYWFLVG